MQSGVLWPILLLHILFSQIIIFYSLLLKGLIFNILSIIFMYSISNSLKSLGWASGHNGPI